MSPRPSRKCKACEPCRSRKVKCDGARPVCFLCQAQRRRCEYGDDRRQNHSVSRETVQVMKDKMASLEAVVERLSSAQGQSQVSTTQETPSAPPTTDLELSPSVSMHPPSTPQRLVAIGGEDTVVRGNNPINDAGEIHTIVRSETGFSIHGPTSAFRDLPSPASLSRTFTSDSPSSRANVPANTTNAATEEDKLARLEQWKLELFANSARQLQLQHWQVSLGKMDLDGVEPPLALHLLDLYFNHQYNTYLCVYRPAVMASLANDGPYANKLLLNGMYYTGALQSGRDDLMDMPGDAQTLGNRFFRRFEELLAPTIRRSSIPSISALIIMGSSLLTRGHQTLGWLYCGMAYRMISDLGLDINPNKVNTSSLLVKEPEYTQNALEAEMQRRIFWGAYMNDRFNSLYFGRPPSLHILKGFEPDRECLDMHDELETWTPCYDTVKPPSAHIMAPKYNVSNRDCLLKLADITSDIIDKFYRPGLEYRSSEAACQQVTSVQRQLDQWAEELPTQLYYDPKNDTPVPPHRFYPHTTYHTLHILLYRPFLPEGHLRKVELMPQREIRNRCVSAALNIYSLAQAYRAAYTLTRAPYLFSYALLSAATVIPLLHWEDHHSRLSVIRFFLDALKEQQGGANSGLKKPIMIIRGLFERAGLDLSAPSRNDLERSDNADSGTSGAGPSTGFDAAMPSWESWGGEDYRELFQDFLLEHSDCWPMWDQNVAGGQQEMLFGMFG